MNENNYQKYIKFLKKVLRKLRPRFSFHYVAYTTLIFLVIFSIIQLTSAYTVPNPGHDWDELGEGLFAAAGPATTLKTFTFPNANATVLTTNSAVTVAQGGTGLTTVAAGSVLGYNTLDTASAITSSTGTKILTNTSGTISWETASASGATTALDNLASVAINTDLISDTDITDDLGSLAKRWDNVFAQTLSTGDTATDTLKLRGYDTDLTGFVDILTITANNTVTADLNAITTIGGNAIIYSGGALGTPSSGTVTNLTGTASININGTVGATTPSTGVFTTATTNTGLMPDADDGAYIGQAGTAFSDLFLAEGGVINWDSGDATLTQVGNVVTLAGASLGVTDLSITSAKTTETTTSSALALNVNSLTTGTGFYTASSSLSSGSLFDLAVTGTAGLTGQKGINVSLSGANATGAQTTYGAYLSNTHSGTSTNVGLYTTASGGSNNLGLNVDAGQTLLGGTTLTTESATQTLAKLNIVSTMTANGSNSAIAGIHGYYTFTNGGNASYVQVGNRFYFNNAPTTNANTMAGEIIRVNDDTSLANLVRGIDVNTVDDSSNTAGTNTGIRARGGTFGIQGSTNSSAGGVYVPAALYGENTGTTNGDVLRLFSNSVTSAPSFATFYHDTSAFTGTGLLMDFATGSGTFSGNFVDFQKNNSVLFKVTNAGITSMGLGATASTTAVCSSLANTTAPTAGVSYEIRDCSGAPAADYAEMYPVENGVEYGDIVTVGSELINTYDTANGGVDWEKVKGKVTKLVKSTDPYQKNVIGIASNNYGDFSSVGNNIKEEDNPMPVALNGRVPVKVSNNSEPIEAGDYLTTSSEPGKAEKAVKSGQVIGKALEPWEPNSGKETVMLFVEQGYQNGESLASSFDIDINSVNKDGVLASQKILEELINNDVSTDDYISEVSTDRLVAGLEIITPNIVTNNLSAEGEVNFNGLTYFGGNVDFAESVKFKNQVEFEVPPLFNNDTAGFAVIKEGSKEVRVSFDAPYMTTPVVTTDITFEKTGEDDSNFNEEEFFNHNIESVIKDKDNTGFTIVLNKIAPEDINFSWIALAVKDAKVYESVIDGLVIDDSTTEEVIDEITDTTTETVTDTTVDTVSETEIKEDKEQVVENIIEEVSEPKTEMINEKVLEPITNPISETETTTPSISVDSDSISN